MFEQADAMAGVFKLVDVGPDLGLPALLVGGRFAAGRAAGMQRDRNRLDPHWGGSRQFHEDAAHFLDLFVRAQDVLITQQVSKTEFLGLRLGLAPGVKGTLLRPQLLGGVTRHPENLFVGHRCFRPAGFALGR